MPLEQEDLFDAMKPIYRKLQRVEKAMLEMTDDVEKAVDSLIQVRKVATDLAEIRGEMRAFRIMAGRSEVKVDASTRIQGDAGDIATDGGRIDK